MKKINASIPVALGDDHEVFRFGLKKIIESTGKYSVVIEVSDGKSLLSALEKKLVRVVVLDLKMPTMNGMELIPIIKKKFAEVKIVVVTVYSDIEHAKAAIRLGVNGYVLKIDPIKTIMQGIESALENKLYVSPTISNLVFDDIQREALEELPLLEILTKREMYVFKLLLAGNTNKEIAKLLKISIRTVELHRGNVYRKLGVDSIADLFKLAIKYNLKGI